MLAPYSEIAKSKLPESYDTSSALERTSGKLSWNWR
jgi:hypothetical protein